MICLFFSVPTLAQELERPENIETGKLPGEDAKWQQAIKDALALEELHPREQPKRERPELLRGVEDPKERLAIYHQAIALYSSDLPDWNDRQRELDRRRQLGKEALRYGGTEAVPALLEACQAPNAQLRWIAISFLQRRGRAALDTLHDMALHDPDSDVRTSAIHAIRDIQAPESAPFLIQALQDTDPNVVISAAKTLGDLREKEALKPLAQLLEHREGLHQYGWYSVCAAMMKIDADFARPIVVPYLETTVKPRNPNDENNRQGILKRAAQPRYATGWLIGIRKEAEPARTLAADAFTIVAESFGEDEINLLIQHLDDENRKIARACNEALVHLEARQAIPHLINAINQKDTYNHREQLTALLQFGGKEGITGFVNIYRESLKPDAHIQILRHVAPHHLADLGPVSVPLLIAMLDDKLVTRRTYTVGFNNNQKVIITRSHAALNQLGKLLKSGKIVNLWQHQHNPVVVDPVAQILSMKTWWRGSREAYLAGQPTPPPPEVTMYTAENPLSL